MPLFFVEYATLLSINSVNVINIYTDNILYINLLYLYCTGNVNSKQAI